MILLTGTQRDRLLANGHHLDQDQHEIIKTLGVGPIIATAIAALAQPPETFTKGRDFAAWLLGTTSVLDRW